MTTPCGTPCVCENGGFCQRHQIHKSLKWVQLCQRNPAYFALWESGRGPGQVPVALRERLSQPPVTGGPGTELSKILGRFGLRDRKGCKCKSRAAKMDRWGCDKCEKKLDEIVGWLQEEAQQRRLPFVASVGKIIVRRAIRRARQLEEKQ